VGAKRTLLAGVGMVDGVGMWGSAVTTSSSNVVPT
jgi:hypothetical protein